MQDGKSELRLNAEEPEANLASRTLRVKVNDGMGLTVVGGRGS